MKSEGKDMGTSARPADGAITLAELREFASFPAATQRYIRRSLDIGLHRRDAMKQWSRDMVEEASIRAQARVNERLDEIKARVPDDRGLDRKSTRMNSSHQCATRFPSPAGIKQRTYATLYS